MANITDINDKIYAAAREAGVPSEALAAEMTEHYKADTERLGLGRPDHEPLASEYVEPIVALIADLIERGHAYAVDGDVYFRVRSLPEYGELSHRAVDEMDQGEGVEGAARKEDALDFALWKGEKEDEERPGPRRGGWGGPAGTSSARRWRRSCSASSSTSTAAAATCCSPTTRTRRRRRWPPAGARSRGCGCTTGCCSSATRRWRSRTATSAGWARSLDEVGRDTLIMYFVGGHYRQPIAYSRERLDAAAASVERIREAGRRLVAGDSPEDLAPLRDAFFDALADDFNTARALASLFDWIREANRREGPVGDAHLREMLGRAGARQPARRADGPPPELLELAERRARGARAARDFAEADRLRDELRAAGWEVRDGPKARAGAGGMSRTPRPLGGAGP